MIKRGYLIAAIVAAGVLVMLKPKKAADGTMPLGIRNNNPLNMRDYGINWQGKTGTNQGFTTFETPFFGIRAAGNDLKNKWLRGLDTIAAIISVWAPENGQSQDGEQYQNPTAGYIAFVSERSGIAADLRLNSLGQYVAVVEAMIQKENGQQPFALSEIEQAIRAGMTSGAPLPSTFGGLA